MPSALSPRAFRLPPEKTSSSIWPAVWPVCLAPIFFIGLIDERDAQRINTLAVCSRGQITADISYSLPGTPCANVVGQRTCVYPRDVQQLFPQDMVLIEKGAESYIGAPLFDSQGKALSLIVIVDNKPLEHVEQVREILEIFAARAGAEVQRLRAEEHVQRLAYRDELTGLASRARLHEDLFDALAHMRSKGDGGAASDRS